MTDKELLKLAAKAAGIKYRIDNETIVEVFYDGHAEWNPIEDDGDALRLAVKIQIQLSFTDKHSIALSFDVGIFSEHHGIDPNAATRRAIVRAAAEAGRAIQ